MEVSESLRTRAVSALWIEENEGHWRSTLSFHPTHRVNRLRDGVRRISQLLVLRVLLLGDPVGQLSNACGRSECVNPYHYRDQSEREQLTWRIEAGSVDIVRELGDAGLSLEDLDYFGMRVISIVNLAPTDILNAYGMTHDMGCYCCGARFEPLIEDEHGNSYLAPGNGVICPACWTEEDQMVSEESDAD